jgi:hypothetical protein
MTARMAFASNQWAPMITSVNVHQATQVCIGRHHHHHHHHHCHHIVIIIVVVIYRFFNQGMPSS